MQKQNITLTKSQTLPLTDWNEPPAVHSITYQERDDTDN